MTEPAPEADGRRPTARTALLAAAAAVLAAPLIYSQLVVNSVTAGRSVWVRVLVSAGLVALAVTNLRRRRGPPLHRDPFFLLLAVFVVLLSVSGLLGASPFRSFFGTLGRGWGVVVWLHLAGFYALLAGGPLDREGWDVLLRSSLVVAGAVGLITLWGVHLGGSVAGIQIGLDESRPGGPLGNPGFLGSYVLLQLVVLVLALRRWGTTPGRLAWGLPLGGILLWVLWLTQTRALLLGLGVAAAAGGLLLAVLAGDRRARVAGAAVTAAACAGALVLWRWGDAAWVREIGGLERLARAAGEADESLEIRFMAWRAALEGIAERPLLGIGPENFNLLADRHFDPWLYGLNEQATHHDRAHNVYLGTAATGGLPAAAAYTAALLLLPALAVRGWLRGRLDRWEAGALFAGIVAYLVYLFFWFESFGSMLTLLLLAAYMAHGVRSAPDGAAGPKAPGPGSSRRIPLAAAGLLLLAFNLWQGGQLLASTRDAREATRTFDVWEGADRFTAAVSRPLVPTWSLTGRYLDYLQRVTYRVDAFDEGYEHTDRLRGSLEVLRRALTREERRDPANASVQAKWASLERLAWRAAGSEGAPVRAEARLARAVELAPRRIVNLHQLADLRLRGGDPAGARAALERALSVYDGFGGTYARLSDLAWETGDRERAVTRLRVSLELGYGRQPMLRMLGVLEWLRSEGRPGEAARFADAYLAANYSRGPPSAAWSPDREALRPDPAAGDWRYRPWHEPVAGRLPLLWWRAGRVDRAEGAARELLHHMRGDAEKRGRAVRGFLEDLGAGRAGRWEAVDDLLNPPDDLTDVSDEGDRPG